MIKEPVGAISLLANNSINKEELLIILAASEELMNRQSETGSDFTLAITTLLKRARKITLKL